MRKRVGLVHCVSVMKALKACMSKLFFRGSEFLNHCHIALVKES